MRALTKGARLGAFETYSESDLRGRHEPGQACFGIGAEASVGQ